MPVTLEVVQQAGKLSDLISTVDKFFNEHISQERRKLALNSIQEAADRSALTGPDMMRTLASLQRDGVLKGGLYKELADLDTRVTKALEPKIVTVKTKAPKEKVEKKLVPTGPTHPDKPEYLKRYGYLYPVPDEIIWRKSSAVGKFHALLRKEPI